MLHDPTVRLHEVEVSLFSPFRPMLGDRGQPHTVRSYNTLYSFVYVTSWICGFQIETVMQKREFVIETKFDGERMQLHKSGDSYKFFSRNGNDYTHVFGSDEWSGTFTPFIANCFKPEVRNCILDGEMVGFDPVRETIGNTGKVFVGARYIFYIFNAV